VFYRTSRGKFEVRFASRQEMELAVKEWFAQATQRGEFFRVGSVKTLLKARRSHSHRDARTDGSTDGERGIP
jgi:hypothetical protein